MTEQDDLPDLAHKRTRMNDSREKSDNDPSKVAAKRFWAQLWRTRVGRLFALGYVLLAVLGWLVAQFEVVGKVWGFFTKPPTFATLDEITCLNEWVLKLANENSQMAAEQTRAKFLDYYRGLGHVN